MRILSTARAGGVAFILAAVLIVIGIYIKCYFNNIGFIFSVALEGALKGGALMGALFRFCNIWPAAFRARNESSPRRIFNWNATVVPIQLIIGHPYDNYKKYVDEAAKNK